MAGAAAVPKPAAAPYEAAVAPRATAAPYKAWLAPTATAAAARTAPPKWTAAPRWTVTPKVDGRVRVDGRALGDDRAQLDRAARGLGGANGHRDPRRSLLPVRGRTLGACTVEREGGGGKSRGGADYSCHHDAGVPKIHVHILALP